MRGIAGLVLLLPILVACQHLPGSQASDAELIEIAKRHHAFEPGGDAKVTRSGKYATVYSVLPCPVAHTCLGGDMETTIDLRTLKVVRTYVGQ